MMIYGMIVMIIREDNISLGNDIANKFKSKDRIDSSKKYARTNRTSMIEEDENSLFEKISNKYKIDEDSTYDTLYLKVRNMFLEEDR